MRHVLFRINAFAGIKAPIAHKEGAALDLLGHLIAVFLLDGAPVYNCGLGQFLGGLPALFKHVKGIRHARAHINPQEAVPHAHLTGVSVDVKDAGAVAVVCPYILDNFTEHIHAQRSVFLQGGRNAVHERARKLVMRNGHVSLHGVDLPIPDEGRSVRRRVSRDAEAQAQRRAQQQRRQDFPESDFRHDSSSFIRVFPIFLFNNSLSSCTSLL